MLPPSPRLIRFANPCGLPLAFYLPMVGCVALRAAFGRLPRAAFRAGGQLSAFSHPPSSIRHLSSAREVEALACGSETIPHATSPGHLPSGSAYRSRNFAYFFRSAGVNGTAPCLRMIAMNSATVKIPNALAGAET